MAIAALLRKVFVTVRFLAMAGSTPTTSGRDTTRMRMTASSRVRMMGLLTFSGLGRC
jgi:hypothetical protein